MVFFFLINVVIAAAIAAIVVDEDNFKQKKKVCLMFNQYLLLSASPKVEEVYGSGLIDFIIVAFIGGGLVFLGLSLTLLAV